MFIISKIYQFWLTLTNLGINEEMPIELVIKSRLLNIMYFITSIWGLAILTLSLVNGNLNHLIVIGGSFIYKTICFLLNVTGKHLLAWMLLILGYSTYLAWFWIFIDSAWDSGFVQLIIIFLIFIIFKGIYQIILVAYACLMYLGAPMIAPYIPEIYKSKIETLPYVTEYSFVFYIILSGVLLTFYQQEIKRNRKAQARTIDDLKNSNTHFQSIKNELEQFINVASGELQRKLEVIQRQISKMRKSLAGEKTEEVFYSLKIANASAQQMYFWVNDILEFSDLSQQSPQIEAVNLKSLVEEIISELQIEKARIEYQSLPTLQMNYQEIKVIFQHLIENSLRYNRAEMPVLKINSIVSEDRMSIIFKNNGKGISEKYEEQILKNYKRIHDYETYEGIGLGLGIAKKLTTKLGGRLHLRAKSEENAQMILEFSTKVNH